MIPHEPPTNARTPSKREYVPPRLERLGTIRELTQGAGKDGAFDQTHPPGQNKSF